MQDHYGVLARLDHFVEVTDATFAHRTGQRPVLPPGPLSTDQVTADQVRCAQVIVAGHGVQRQVQALGHVLDETGLATAGGAFDQHRQAVAPGLFKQRQLIALCLVEKFGSGFTNRLEAHAAPGSAAGSQTTLKSQAPRDKRRAGQT
ncbi:hypothetical protein D9M71_424950 [compost metagenome]